jgi:hypothetical protein
MPRWNRPEWRETILIIPNSTADWHIPCNSFFRTSA